ncbi:MAG TPA: GNAT family N-acetyltransferase [Allosphingosinicella sp.]|nr:GNAT family N-acetyltransferase [Allosphingosinicella sp.]
MHGTLARIESIACPKRLRALRPEWEDLAAASAEPNMFMEPMAVLPALDYPDADGVVTLACWSAGPGGGRRLDGMLILKPWARSPLLPRTLESWSYRLRASGDPLIRQGCERTFWSAMLPAIDRLPGTSALRLAQLRGDGAPARALIEVARTLGRAVYQTRCIERASLAGGGSREAYLKRLPQKALREQRRRRKRLEELGPVTVRQLGPAEDPQPWIEAFLALEAAGWKGRRGVAAASEPHVERLVRSILAESHAAGRLDMLRLDVSGRPISMLAHIRSGRTAISFKIAYDEAYARFSPGVLLQMEWLQAGLALDGTDSCAVPGHPMFESLWLERRPIVTLMVPADRPLARFACAAEQRLRALHAKLRRRSTRA